MSLPSLVPLIGIADVIIGLSLGSRLFLIAVGLSLIFGVLGVLNFAHGGFYMLGAYVTLAVVTNVVDNFWLAVVAGAPRGGCRRRRHREFAAIRPLYDRVDADLDQLIVTFGFVLVIHEAVRFIWGSGSYSIDPPDVFNFSVALGGSTFSAYRLVVIGLAVAVLVSLWLFITRTYFGSLVRGTSSDREMASMLGVDVPRLYTGVFFLGERARRPRRRALSPPPQSTSPALGDQVIIDAFIVVVIGGLGSMSGAFVGAMLIGMMQSLGPQFISAGSIAIPFLAMVIVLLFRPEGLFGGSANERVDRHRRPRQRVRLGRRRRLDPRTVRASRALGLILLAFGPSFQIYLFTDFLVVALFALGFNLLYGYTGLLSFGHGLFYAGGAYGVAIVLRDLGPVFADLVGSGSPRSSRSSSAASSA